MIPFTTHTFTISGIDGDLLASSSIRVVVRQNDTVLVKSMDDGSVTVSSDHKYLLVMLNQQETGMFLKGRAKIQAHGITNQGVAWKTYVMTTDVGETLDSEVMEVAPK